MAKCLSLIHNRLLPPQLAPVLLRGDFFHTSSTNPQVVAAKTKISVMRDKPVTYERYYNPCDIAHRKSFNVWNNTTIDGGFLVPESIFEEEFIRRFIMGTFHLMVKSEIMIKRQHNIIRIAFILWPKISASKLCFLIGYTEEMLGFVIQAPIKLELQSIRCETDTVYRYI